MLTTIGILSYGSLVGKFEMAKLVVSTLVESHDLIGDEIVLDVGCGRGILLSSVAIYLKEQWIKNSGKQKGKVIGIDLWVQSDQANNHFGNTWRNVEIEGVQEFAEIVTSDMRQLNFTDNYFTGGVVSSLAIHNIFEREFDEFSRNERKKAIDEIIRVAGHNSKIVIWDIFCGQEYFEVLKNHPNITNASISDPFYVFYPSHIVQAIKI